MKSKLNQIIKAFSDGLRGRKARRVIVAFCYLSTLIKSIKVD
jgi:hypothetical protein